MPTCLDGLPHRLQSVFPLLFKELCLTKIPILYFSSLVYMVFSEVSYYISILSRQKEKPTNKLSKKYDLITSSNIIIHPIKYSFIIYIKLNIKYPYLIFSK
jgi:hypothetical protein